jgi:hypothetical protein
MSDYSCTIHFQDGQPDLTIPVVEKNQAMEEGYVPGSPIGTGNLILFFKFTGTAQFPGVTQLSQGGVAVRKGDTATVNSVLYDIHRVNVDPEAGASLYMRRRTN